jgi:hypothetical protein
MSTELQDLREQVILWRRKLSALETKRAAYGEDVPSQLWRDLVEAARQLEAAEGAAKLAGNKIAEQVNHTRDVVLEKVAEYNQWRIRMHEMDNCFLNNILRPGYRLRDAVQQRQFLEGEYRRIKRLLETEGYNDLAALKMDVRAVLMEAGGYEEPDPFDEAADQELGKYHLEDLKDLDADLLVGALEKEQITREFKQVVLPAIHPDTSETDEDTFRLVFEVYENRDYLLMQAYTLQYRGPVEVDCETAGLEWLDEILLLEEEYHSVSRRLSKRLDRLKDELTSHELEDPDKLQEDLLRQRDDILERLQLEIERILELRLQIEGLVKEYLTIHGDWVHDE